jgi:Winged helix DNA-binding domain
LTRPYTLTQLRRASLRRQFPRVRRRGPKAVAELVGWIGPIQSQAPRAPFLGVAARLPGVGYAAIVDAFETHDIVKGSNIRGTVHTCVREHFPLLDAVTRRTSEPGWRKVLGLRPDAVGDVRAEIVRWVGDEWRLESDLTTHVTEWLTEHESAESAALSRESSGRFLLRGYSPLLRRPSRGGWEQRSPWLLRHGPPLLGTPEADPDDALVALARIHIASFGPSTRHDIAWWAGERLKRVDAALAALGADVVARPGPGGGTYFDLSDPPPGGSGDPGVRLLPEFDSLVLGYHPKGRTRFLDESHLDRIWNRANGTFSPTVLSEGRLVGLWRLVGNGRRRDLDVWPLPGESLPAENAFVEPVDGVAAALDVEIGDLRLTSGG